MANWVLSISRLRSAALSVKLVGHLARSEIGKIAFRQCLQRETRTAGADRQRGAVAGGFKHDLRAFGQFAHDVVEHMRRHRRRPAGAGFGRDRVGHFEIEVGGLQAEFRTVSANEHIGEDRNGVAPLHRAMHVAKRFQQFGALYGDLHREIRCRWG